MAMASVQRKCHFATVQSLEGQGSIIIWSMSLLAQCTESSEANRLPIPPEEILLAQKEGRFIGPVSEWMIFDAKPGSQLIKSFSMQTRHLMSEWESLTPNDVGMLHYKTAERTQLVLRAKSLTKRDGTSRDRKNTLICERQILYLACEVMNI